MNMETRYGLIIWAYVASLFLIAPQIGTVFASSNTIQPPYQNYASNPSSLTCVSWSFGAASTYRCAYPNLNYGWALIYSSSAVSYCNDGSCPAAPSATAEIDFNPNGPYATYYFGNLYVTFSQADAAYGLLTSTAGSGAQLESVWYVSYSPCFGCTQTSFTRYYHIDVYSETGGSVSVNAVYEPSVTISFPSGSWYTVAYGGPDAYSSVPSPGAGGSSGDNGTANFYYGSYAVVVDSITA